MNYGDEQEFYQEEYEEHVGEEMRGTEEDPGKISQFLSTPGSHLVKTGDPEKDAKLNVRRAEKWAYSERIKKNKEGLFGLDDYIVRNPIRRKDES